MTLTILLADDDDNVRDLGAMALGLDSGVEVLTAASGAEALALVDGGAAPDVFLLDHSMPGMTGAEVMAALRSRPAVAGRPVVFLTAHAGQADQERLMALGAAGVITKPFAALELAARVRALAGADDDRR